MQLERLTYRQWILLALPSLVTSSLFVPFSFLVQPFYADKLGLGLAIVGSILTFGRLLDVVIDPIVGWLSDRTRTRWGRRRPWALGSILIFMAGEWMLFSPGIHVTPAYMAAAVTSFYVGATAFVIPYHAWAAEISSDYHERTRISALIMWMVAAGVLLTTLLLGIMERGYHLDIGHQLHYLGCIYVIAIPLIIAALLFNVPEVAERGHGLQRSLVTVIRHYVELFCRPDFARINSMNFLSGAAGAINIGLYVFFAMYALKLDKWVSSLLLVETLVSLVSIPFWLALARRRGKARTLYGVLAIDTLVPLTGLFIPPGQVGLLIAQMIARGITWGAQYMILQSLLSDQINHLADHKGVDAAGTSFAVFNLVQKIAGAITIGLVYWVLARWGFDPAHGQTNATPVRLIFSLTPAALTALSLFFVRGIEVAAAPVDQTAHSTDTLPPALYPVGD